MTISFEKALGVHEQALTLRDKRTAIIANNIANADTPGFKARDLDFQSALAKHISSDSSSLRASNPRHISTASPASEVNLSYRAATQPSLDGNTVDEQVENAAFAKNAIDHQASFQFLNGKFTGLIKALRGE
ncbi:MAG: flagellar basal body rod protein FlgB [Pseudohongiellaceae bacterium]